MYVDLILIPIWEFSCGALVGILITERIIRKKKNKSK